MGSRLLEDGSENLLPYFRSLRRSRDEIACSNSAISRFTGLADSILLLADADDATMLENPISLFSFRFPVERETRGEQWIRWATVG